MRLYSGPLSLFTAKVRIALAEKGIDYERVEVGFTRKDGYEPKHPDVLALNPRAQVPVLTDGDLALYDSTVIIEYLEDLVPGPPLMPRDPVERARCRMLEQHADEIFFPQVLVLIREVFYKDAAERDGALVDEAVQRLLKELAELDARLVGRDFIVDAFSAADVAWHLSVLFASQLGAPIPPELANATKWFARVAARPAVAREIAEITDFAAKLPA